MSRLMTKKTTKYFPTVVSATEVTNTLEVFKIPKYGRVWLLKKVIDL